MMLAIAFLASLKGEKPSANLGWGGFAG